MINYSKRSDLNRFKQELLNDRFFCKTDNSVKEDYTFTYKDLPTNDIIKQSYAYTLAKSMIENNSRSFEVNIEDIFYGKKEISEFKRKFLAGLYVEAQKKKKTKELVRSLESVFNIIFDYDKTKVMEMYSPSDFNILENTALNDNKTLSSAYKFNWDVIGYAFGKIQLNIKANPKHIKVLKDSGFTEEELELLTNPKPKGKTKKQLEEQVAHLNPKLLKNKKIIDNYCLDMITYGMRKICNYKFLDELILEDETIFIQFVDYDNQFNFDAEMKEGHLGYEIAERVKKGIRKYTLKDFMDFKATTKEAKKSKLHKDSILKRCTNIQEAVKPVAKDVSVKEASTYFEPINVLNIIAINEVSLHDNAIYTHNIKNMYYAKVNDVLDRTEITVDKINISTDKDTGTNKEEDSKNNAEKVVEKINKELNISSKISDEARMNAYDISNMVIVANKLFDEFDKKYANYKEDMFVSFRKIHSEFVSLCRTQNNLMSGLDTCNKKLKELNDMLINMELSYNEKYNTAKQDLDIVKTYFDNLCKAYEYMMDNEFAKTNLLATGIISKANAFLFSNDSAMQVFADSFLSKKPDGIERKETDKPNPLTIILKNSEFLSMKELDYRNLEAYLRQSQSINPSSLGCRRIWILIYVILNLIARKNVVYCDKKEKVDEEDFVNHISILLDKIRRRKWNHEYSDIEKQFSCMFPFVRYKDNPFSDMMRDKGFNQSQKHAKELRLYVEEQMKSLTDSVKEFVYGENKIYDIFQGLADIAYELSNPIALYTDFSIADAGESIVNQFLNACVSSVEMQTAMSIYEFIFNFSIKIKDKEYTLNDLNNMLKMFNLIVEVSKENKFAQQVQDREKLCRYTSDYQMFKKIGFYTYNKKFNKTYDNVDDILKNITGFYLSDETDLYDLVEYCRKKNTECEYGDLRTLMSRFQKLEFHEWFAAYACHRLKNEDKKYADMFDTKVLFKHELGYLQIQNIVSSLEREGKNDNPDVTYVNPYLENLGTDIIAHPEEFDKFKADQMEMFRRFRVNMNRNEKVVISHISKKLSDEKIYDWMMKMLPTYEMIAEAFGFASLSGISTLDKFMESLMESLNGIIKISFDKWKSETTETMNLRRFRFLAKERYYYIQSFPIMIDWVVKNLEHYILACNLVSKSEGIDFNASNDNLEKIDELATTFIIKLKEELSCMSNVQIEIFKKEFEEMILSISDINQDEAKKLINDIFQTGSIKDMADNLFNFSLDFMTEEQKAELVEKLEEISQLEEDKELSEQVKQEEEKDDYIISQDNTGRFKFSENSLKRFKGVHPKMQEFMMEMLKISPYDFTITAGVRTAAEQNKLFQKGRTTPGKIITNCDGYNIKSNHQAKNDGYGYAMDIAPYVNGRTDYSDKYFYAIVNASRGLMEKYNVEWGGDWVSLDDKPHFELKR